MLELLIKNKNAKEDFADNHGYHISRVFNIWPNFPFITSETKPDDMVDQMLQNSTK